MQNKQIIITILKNNYLRIQIKCMCTSPVMYTKLLYVIYIHKYG